MSDEKKRRVSLSNSDDSEEGCRRTSRVREASHVSFYSAVSSPVRADTPARSAAKASRARRKRRPHSSPRGEGDTQGPQTFAAYCRRERHTADAAHFSFACRGEHLDARPPGIPFVLLGVLPIGDVDPGALVWRRFFLCVLSFGSALVLPVFARTSSFARTPRLASGVPMR